ncbi:MAG: Sau3AI family type II restriction endonuclease [Bacilli bacterium]
MFDYDDANEESILNYAKTLVGKSVQNVIDDFNNSVVKHYIDPSKKSEFKVEDSVAYNTELEYKALPNAKGEIGKIIENNFFGYKSNSNQEPDFPKIGVELKITCFDKLKKKYSAGERLSITNISYNDPVEEDFYKSHVWDKIKRILLIHYLRDKSKERSEYIFKYVNLFTPPEEDLKIIKSDYFKIINKIKAGEADTLSESDTFYLGACTKGSTAEKSKRPQYYGNHALAKKRNFCFKQQYMEFVLQEYVLQNCVPYESIIKNGIELTDISFEDFVLKKINNNIGCTDYDLCVKYKLEYTNNKAQWINLAYRMLGIKTCKAKEFVKANVVVKTIRLEDNNKIKESMNFPPFKFLELKDENWEDSSLYNYLENTKFLFVIFKRDGSYYRLLGSQLWNIPSYDLNVVVRKGWEDIRNCIINGIDFDTSGKVVKNSLPGKKNNEIIHIRPHSQLAAYKLNNGFTQGNVKRDANELPNGEWMTTQSFWFNSSYILKQLKYK